MEHTYEKAFLLGVREKLDESEAAVVAYHRKACAFPFLSEAVDHFYKAPVHLEHLSGPGGVASYLSLRQLYRQSSCRYKVLVCLYEVLYRCKSAGIPQLHQLFHYYS